MVVIITYIEKENNLEMVSHGYDTEMLEDVELPNIPLESLPTTYNEHYKEYVLKDPFS